MRIAEVLDAESEPVVLVGHSVSGMAICEALQRDTIAASGVTDVVELPRSHSPFLSAPKELAETLERLAA